MRNLLHFLTKYSILLLFLLFEIVAFILFVSHNNRPQSAVLSSANRFAAIIYDVNSSVVDYFSLSEQNKLLIEENSKLREQLILTENRLEKLAEDSVLSYIYADKNLKYIAAKVINSSTNLECNYLTINKGRRDSVDSDMAVISKDGVVGIVSQASDKFAVVIPIINSKLIVSCKLEKNGHIGTLNWSGHDYRYAELIDIARHIEVSEGDTIITSGLSDVFPEGMFIGIVDKISLSESDAYYKIKVRLGVDYRNLKYITVIENKNIVEQLHLENEAMIR